MSFWACESFFRSEIEAEVFKTKYKLSTLSYHISCTQTISKGKLKEGTVRERRVRKRYIKGKVGSFGSFFSHRSTVSEVMGFDIQHICESTQVFLWKIL